MGGGARKKKEKNKDRRQRVAHHQTSLGTAVHKLTRVETLGSNEPLLVLLVLVLVAKLDASQRSSAAGIVLDRLDDALHESMTLGKVVLAQLGGSQARSRDGLEDASPSLTLMASSTTHNSALSNNGPM